MFLRSPHAAERAMRKSTVGGLRLSKRKGIANKVSGTTKQRFVSKIANRSIKVMML